MAIYKGRPATVGTESTPETKVAVSTGTGTTMAPIQEVIFTDAEVATLKANRDKNLSIGNAALRTPATEKVKTDLEAKNQAQKVVDQKAKEDMLLGKTTTARSGISWNSTTPYSVGTVVWYTGNNYKALVANTNVVPGTLPTTWQVQVTPPVVVTPVPVTVSPTSSQAFLAPKA